MISFNEPFYVVNGFGLGEDSIFSSFGFSTRLDFKFAKRFYEKEITLEQINYLNERGENIIRNILDYKSNLSFIYPYYFLENEKRKPTFLLQFCSIFDDTSDLGIDGMKLKDIKDEIYKGVEYNSHNMCQEFLLC